MPSASRLRQKQFEGALRHRLGITLAETAFAVFLSGILVAGALRTMGSALQTHRFSSSRIQATLLAEQLIVELSCLNWTDPDAPLTAGTIGRDTGDPTGTVIRSALDDMDDFHNWTETPADRTGNRLAGTNGQTRRVTVANLSSSDFSTEVSNSTDTGVRRLTVTVSDSSGELAQISTILSRAESSQRMTAAEQPAVPSQQAAN